MKRWGGIRAYWLDDKKGRRKQPEPKFLVVELDPRKMVGLLDAGKEDLRFSTK